MSRHDDLIVPLTALGVPDEIIHSCVDYSVSASVDSLITLNITLTLKDGKYPKAPPPQPVLRKAKKQAIPRT